MSLKSMSSGFSSLSAICCCTVCLLLQKTVLTAFKSVKYHLHITPFRLYFATETRETLFLCRNSVSQSWVPWGNTEGRMGYAVLSLQK